VVAEADRLSIEAVRRSEEARAEQVGAERKAAAAKVASEAAAIAADALRLLRTSGLAVAIMRLEEAQTLEQGLQSGRFPVGEIGASLRPPGAASVAPPAGYPEAVTTQPSPAFNLIPDLPRLPAPPPPPPPAPLSTVPAAAASAQPPMAPMPIPQAPPVPVMAAVPSHPSAPRSPSMGPPPSLGVQASPSLAPPVQGPPLGAGAIDLSALPVSFQPTIFGLPRTVVISLSAIALFVVVVLALLLAK